jgi:hypothetical protein
MRPDQRARLAELDETLTDILIDELDPRNWPAAGVALAQMEKGERGDRYWHKKSAAMTMVIIKDVNALSENTKGALGRDPLNDVDLDRRIDAAEANAKRLVDEVMAKANKALFDRKVHGGKP